jgi:hypothetical protein
MNAPDVGCHPPALDQAKKSRPILDRMPALGATPDTDDPSIPWSSMTQPPDTQSMLAEIRVIDII